MNWFKVKDLTEKLRICEAKVDAQRNDLNKFIKTYIMEKDISRDYDVGDVRVRFDWRQFEVFIDGKIVAWGPDSRQAMLHFKEWFHEGEENATNETHK